MRYCYYCGHEVVPDSSFTWRLVLGWERRGFGASRRGGADIVLREKREVFACGPCINKRKEGLSVNQESLPISLEPARPS